MSLRRQSRCWPGLQSYLKIQLGEDLFPSSFTWLLMGVSSSQAIGLRLSVSRGQGSPSVSQHMDLPTGLPQVMVCGFIQCERSETTPKKPVFLFFLINSFSFFFFLATCAACRILVPQPGIEPAPCSGSTES